MVARMILYRTADTSVVRFKQRQVDVVAVPFGQVITADDGQGEYREAFDPSLSVELLRDPVPALLHHDPMQPFGHVDVRGKNSDGVVATLHAARTATGDEALELAAALILYPSIGFSGARHVTRDRVRWRTSIVLHEISLVTFQAYAGATVTGVRATVPAGTPNLDRALGLANIRKHGKAKK
jgi:uncharacterized protein